MKANSDKIHLLLSCNEPSALMIDGPPSKQIQKKCFLE